MKTNIPMKKPAMNIKLKSFPGPGRVALKLLLAGCLAADAQGAGVFTSTSPSYWRHEAHTATLLTNGMVLIAGGYTINPYNNTVLSLDTDLYDPASDTWGLPGNLNDYHDGHTATLLTNGQVLVAGGGVSSAELYNPVTGVWTFTGSLVAVRSDHTATRLPNGKVLVAGGASNGVTLASAELYDPATGHWTATGSLNTVRDGPTATLLSNGKVLAAVGYGTDYPAVATSSELYDPATGVWTPPGSLGAARAGHTATLLPNGKVLVAGGATNGSELASAEMYDPATGHWTATGSLGAARSGHTATLLPNGKVLVVGGYSTNDVSFSSDLYDPATGTWSPAASLGAWVFGHTATLLANGQVLVAGGYYVVDSDVGMIAGGELYDSGMSFPNPFLNPVKLGDGSFQFGFINGSGPSYSVLAGTNLAATVNTWTHLGAATEMPAGSGLFQFTDHQAPNYPQRFYRVSSPR